MGSLTTTLAKTYLENFTHIGISARSIQSFCRFPKFHQYFKETQRNEYDKDKNPEGIVPFGLAENKIAIDILLPQMKKITKASDRKGVYTYGDVTGEDDFRLSLKKFVEHNFHPQQEIDINTLFVTNGTTSTLENLAFALAQPDEYIMVLRPFYYGLSLDFMTRPGVRTLSVDQPFPSDSPDNRFSLDVPGLEKAYRQAVGQMGPDDIFRRVHCPGEGRLGEFIYALIHLDPHVCRDPDKCYMALGWDSSNKGKAVRAVYLTNPSNPTGDVYTAQELKDLLDFAHRYQLHVIANELYGLSVCDPEVTFTSILSLPLPDPERVHFLWGFSKDFGLSGMRISTLYTKSTGVARYFTQTAIYIQPTALAQGRLKPLIDDLAWTSFFLPELRRRMRTRHQSVKGAIEECGGHVHPSPATIFRWIDLSPFLPSPDWAGEHQLFLRMLSGGVHLVEGSSLGHAVPGWFRMVAALDDDVHQEGMKRLTAVLKNILSEKEQQQQ